MSRQSDAADAYARYGWRVVPCHAPRVSPSGARRGGVCTCYRGEDCGDSAGKHPRLRQWQDHATSDPIQVAEWFRQWPEANVGVVLGEASGIVDLECDSAEAEAAFVEMFDGEPPVTVCFRSRRGIHRLFRWRPGLPNQASMRAWGIDVKIGNGSRGTQSIFPGSYHGTTGDPIDWIVSPEDGAVADLPDAVVGQLNLVLNAPAGMHVPPRGEMVRIAPDAPAGQGASQLGSRPASQSSLGGYRDRLAVEAAPDVPPDPLCADFENAVSESGGDVASLNPDYSHLFQASDLRQMPVWREIARASAIMSGGRDVLLFKLACSQARRMVMSYGPACFDDEDHAQELRDVVCGLNLLKVQPPLDHDVAVVKAEQAMRYSRQDAESRITEQLSANYAAIGLVKEGGEWWPGDWRLEITDAENAEFILRVPWASRPLVFTAEQFHNAASIQQAAAGWQVTLSPRPGIWAATWHGTKGNKKEGTKGSVGLMSKLIQDARQVTSSPEQDIRKVIAESLLNLISTATSLANRTLPTTSGRIYRREPGGSIVFRFEFVLQEMSLIEGVDRARLSRFLNDELEVERWRPGRGGVGGVWREMPASGVARLEQICQWHRLRIVESDQTGGRTA